MSVTGKSISLNARRAVGKRALQVPIGCRLTFYAWPQTGPVFLRPVDRLLTQNVAFRVGRRCQVVSGLGRRLRCPCDHRPEMVHPAPDGLIGDHDPAFRQQIFDVADDPFCWLGCFAEDDRRLRGRRCRSAAVAGPVPVRSRTDQCCGASIGRR